MVPQASKKDNPDRPELAFVVLPVVTLRFFPMKSKYEARREFLNQAEAIVEDVQKFVSDALGDTAKLEIVRPERVDEIVGNWSRRICPLNWPVAVKTCRSKVKSCFVGVRIADAIEILFLIKVSRGSLHTTLLYLERDAGSDGMKGLALPIVEATLIAFAAAFNSDLMLIDKPLPEVVAYYEKFGFATIRTHGKRTVVMARSAKTK
jgi:hypothetical protein